MLIRTIVTIGSLLFLTLETASASELVEMMPRCAPDVHPTTLSALIRTESGGNKYALADAGPGHLPWRIRKNMVRSFYPGTQEEAANIANDLISKGHIVAIGLTQVSSRNLKRLGLTVNQVLDPCTNLRSGGQILTEFYEGALKKYRSSEQALLAAISAYNTGNFQNGFTNGYVNTVITASRQKVPELKSGSGRRSAGIQYAAESGNSVAIASVPKSRQSLLLEAKLASIEVETF